jgi:hypothetical protein
VGRQEVLRGAQPYGIARKKADIMEQGRKKTKIGRKRENGRTK